MTWTFTIPGPPVAKQRPRTVWKDRDGRSLSKPRIYTPKRTTDAECHVAECAWVAGVKLDPEQAYKVTLDFYLSNHRKDGDNLAKTVLDGLQGLGDGWNDCQVVNLEVNKHAVKDGSEERTVVTISARGKQ